MLIHVDSKRIRTTESNTKFNFYFLRENKNKHKTNEAKHIKTGSKIKHALSFCFPFVMAGLEIKNSWNSTAVAPVYRKYYKSWF